MKKKAILAIVMAAVMALSAAVVFALDNGEDTLTARFTLVDQYAQGDQFSMVSQDGETVIYVNQYTPVYFEDYVPATEDEDCEELTRNAREVLFGRTLQEVLDGRNLRITMYEDEIVSITILFEGIVALENGEENGYQGITTLPGDLEAEYWDDENWTPDPIVLIGEIVVNGEMLENAPHPFLQETQNGDVVMVPLRAVAEALGYNVSWNNELRSVQLGVATHLWIGGYEVHVGRMAPIELATAPVIVNNLTFVPIEFFRVVLGQTAYVFEGQVVVAAYSDMM